MGELLHDSGSTFTDPRGWSPVVKHIMEIDNPENIQVLVEKIVNEVRLFSLDTQSEPINMRRSVNHALNEILGAELDINHTLDANQRIIIINQAVGILTEGNKSHCTIPAYQIPPNPTPGWRGRQVPLWTSGIERSLWIWAAD